MGRGQGRPPVAKPKEYIMGSSQLGTILNLLQMLMALS